MGQKREREKVSGDFSRGRGRLVDRERREGRWDRRERVREVSGRGWGEERGGYFLCWIELPHLKNSLILLHQLFTA